jgi:lysophospholipase L1-like esterase
MRSHAIRGAATVAAVLTLLSCTTAPETPTPTPVLDLPVSMVAMGDSITRAAQADGTLGDQPDNSWSTGQGTLVDSLANRISALSGSPVTAANVAVSGAVSADLVNQAAEAVATGAEFVTVLAGSNDVCNSGSVATLPTPAEYSANVRAALEVLKRGLPESSVLLVSMPSIEGLYLAGEGDPAATRAWSSYGICPVALANPGSTDEADVQRRQAVEARVTEMNTALADVAAAFDTVLFDGGRAQRVSFDLSELSSFDYFHPSVTGHNLLVDEEWNVITEAGLFESVPLQDRRDAPSAAVVRPRLDDSVVQRHPLLHSE